VFTEGKICEYRFLILPGQIKMFTTKHLKIEITRTSLKTNTVGKAYNGKSLSSQTHHGEVFTKCPNNLYFQILTKKNNNLLNLKQ